MGRGCGAGSRRSTPAGLRQPACWWETWLFTRAAELILGTRTLPVIEMFTRTMSMMVEGEVSQLARERAISSREEYFCWIGAKTATLFEFACGAPALLGVVDEQAFNSVRRFGYGLGWPSRL